MTCTHGEFFLTFGISYSVGNDRMARPRCKVPVAAMTVQVSEATYRKWWHDALGITADPLFREAIDDNWWTTHAACDHRLSVSGSAWGFEP